MRNNNNCGSSDYLTVGEFIDEFRRMAGDTASDITTGSIIAYTNRALSYLAREKGLQRLFEYEETFDLRRVKNNGQYAQYAHQWVLNGANNLGYIIDVSKLVILDTSGRPCVINAQYLPFHWFAREYPLPELTPAGTPSAFTLKTIQGKTKIIFNAPIARPKAVMLVYSAGHPRVSKESDIIRIPYIFIDLLEQMVQIFYLKESSDYALARSDWEDMDYIVAQIRELLYRQPEGFEPRRIRRSY